MQLDTHNNYQCMCRRHPLPMYMSCFRIHAGMTTCLEMLTNLICRVCLLCIVSNPGQQEHGLDKDQSPKHTGGAPAQ